MVSIVDDVRTVTDGAPGGPQRNVTLTDGILIVKKFHTAFIVTKSDNILEGDRVFVEYTHGLKGEYEAGTLTRKWGDDGPYCQIDGKEIDLAGEGHSSNIYKILAETKDFPEEYKRLLHSHTIQDGDKVSLECRSITREELNEITLERLDIKLATDLDEDLRAKLQLQRDTFPSLIVPDSTLDQMKVVLKPIHIQEWETAAAPIELNDLQKDAIAKWDGNMCLTLHPRGSVGYKAFTTIAREERESEEFWCAMQKMDDLDVPRIDEKNGETFSIVGRIMWLYKNSTMPDITGID